MIRRAVTQSFGRADPGEQPSITVTCGVGLQVIAGGVETRIVNGDEDDLEKVKLLATFPTQTFASFVPDAWVAESVVANRLSQRADLQFTVFAICIPAS